MVENIKEINLKILFLIILLDSWYNMSIFLNTTTNNTNTVNTPYTGPATQVMTVMAWFSLTTGTGASAGSWRDIVTVDPNIYMQIFSDGVSIDYGTANHDHNGNVLTAGVWYHTAQVVVPTSTTSRQIYGYLNGALNVNVTDNDTSLTCTNICIGNSIFSNFVYPLNGNIKDVRVWTRQLSATDIVDEMNSSVPIHKPGLLLWVPLDDNKAVDKSGNNNVLTVGSAITLQAGPMKAFPKKRRSFP
jgi:hypothetical protein